LSEVARAVDELRSDKLLHVRVAHKEIVAQDILLFELVSTNGLPLPAFSAGSHVDIYLPGGLTRQYSLCNNPAESHRYHIAVLRNDDGRGGSRAMHQLVDKGDTLTISLPKNHFHISETATASVLFAGGIGITPLLSMAERMSATGHSFALHYCTRSRARTAFWERIESSGFSDSVFCYFSEEPTDLLLDLPRVLRTCDPNAHLYTCGPKGFMDAVLMAAREEGWSEDRLHYEVFNAELAKLPTDGSFEVELAKSQRTIRVAANETVIEALSANGIQVPVSCEQGVCGTCLTRVLQGQPDHRDFFLTPEEREAGDQFLPCCSRALSSTLLLDL
jgi:vanillate monooxygenase ferredoxin subunit